MIIDKWGAFPVEPEWRKHFWEKPLFELPLPASLFLKKEEAEKAAQEAVEIMGRFRVKVHAKSDETQDGPMQLLRFDAPANYIIIDTNRLRQRRGRWLGKVAWHILPHYQPIIIPASLYMLWRDAEFIELEVAPMKSPSE